MRRRARATGGLVVLLAAGTAAAFGLPAVARLEGRVPGWLPEALVRGQGVHVAHDVVSLGDPTRFAALALAATGVAWWRRGRVQALRTAALLAGATLTTQVLQELLARPRDFGFGARVLAYPSGHMTGAIALGLAVCTALAVRPAATVAVLVGVGGSMALALLALGSHVPSDLLAGVLVSLATGAALGIAGQRGRRSARDARKPSRARVARNHHRAR